MLSNNYKKSLEAYSDYYLAGDRMPFHRPLMTPYASRTGTIQNLNAMRDAGWHILISARGVLRSEGLPYALDNGAWTAYQEGKDFDETAFLRALDKVGDKAEWVVVPDIVCGGMKSLEYSLTWLDRMDDFPRPLLLAVQDGMEPDDIREYLTVGVGIFVGGSTSWKEQTANEWGRLAAEVNCHLHIARVNSQRRIQICASAGAHSFDGSSVSRFSKTMRPLDAARRQQDIFPSSHKDLSDDSPSQNTEWE